MVENMNLVKAETWFEYYKRVYNIYKQNILLNHSDGDLSIQLSFFNSIPQEDDFYEKGQIVKLELFNNTNLLSSICLKTIDSEEQLFQYVWILVVNHFLLENYSKDSKIRINSFDKSTRSFQYLLSDINKKGKPIARANFSLTYNKQDYDEILHQLVLNHNNYHDNSILVQNVRNYILNNVNNPISTDLNNSINQSRKVYENLVHNNYKRVS